MLGQDGWSAELTLHFYVQLKLGMHGIVPPLSHAPSWQGA